jgi:putative membrane protein
MIHASCSPPKALLAWQCTAIALMGFGFVVERFGLFLRRVRGQPLSESQRGFSMWLGTLLLVMGAVVSAISALRFRSVVPGLGEKDIPHGYWTDSGVWLNFALAFVARQLADYFATSSYLPRPARWLKACISNKPADALKAATPMGRSVNIRANS